MKRFLLFSMLALLTVSCSSTFFRAMTRGDAGVDDYLYFPERKISKSDELLEINYALDDSYALELKRLFECEELSDFINKTKTQALLVIKGDKIVFEAYGKKSGRDSIVTSFSVAKSLISAMVGKLLAQGKIQSVEQPITDFIPELNERDSRFSKITIRYLLGMTSGISYSEGSFDNTKTYYDPELRKLALTKTKIAEEPGKSFLYNNYNPLLLGIMIERASGESVSSYMEKNIWKPMGAEADASWSLDSVKDGFEKMESGINARAVDLARFGCLYRDWGMVNGKEVIQKKWIEESLSDHHSGNDDFYCDSFGNKIKNAAKGGYYSYFWYGLKRSDFERDDFFAAGNKSQIIYVSPKSNMVIVRFGAEDGIDFWKWISVFYDLATKDK